MTMKSTNSVRFSCKKACLLTLIEMFVLSAALPAPSILRRSASLQHQKAAFDLEMKRVNADYCSEQVLQRAKQFCVSGMWTELRCRELNTSVKSCFTLQQTL